METQIMAEFEQHAHSFVVRIWQEQQEGRPAGENWRGWVKHVQTERLHYFAKVAEIDTIINHYLDVSHFDLIFGPIRREET